MTSSRSLKTNKVEK